MCSTVGTAGVAEGQVITLYCCAFTQMTYSFVDQIRLYKARFFRKRCSNNIHIYVMNQQI